MNYCSKCQVLCGEQCPHCQSTQLKKPQAGDPVLLLSDEPPVIRAVGGLLQENGVPFQEAIAGQRGAPEIFTGSAGEKRLLFVPYESWNEACELAKAFLPEQAPFAVGEESEPAAENMSPRKRMLVRMVSALLFFVLIWLVVMGADMVTGWLKTLF